MIENGKGDRGNGEGKGPPFGSLYLTFSSPIELEGNLLWEIFICGNGINKSSGGNTVRDEVEGGGDTLIMGKL